MVDATISVYDLEEYLGEDINGGTEGDFDSLGGLLVQVAGRVPEVGTEVSLGDYDLRVLAGDDRHVEQVEVIRRTPTPEEPTGDVPSAQAS